MDLNHIGLTSELISALYKDHIVEVEPGEPSPQKTQIPVIQPARSEVSVIVRYPESTMPDASITLLRNLLSAANLKMNNVQLIDLATDKYSPAINTSKIVLMFGVSPTDIDLPLNFPEYQIQAFNGVTYLCAPALERLEDDKVSKSKLWVCLKRIFNL